MYLIETEGFAEELRLWPVECWKGMATTFHLHWPCKESFCTSTSLHWFPSDHHWPDTGEMCGSLQWVVEQVRSFWRALEDPTWPFWSNCFWWSRFYFPIILIHKSRKPQERSTLLKKGFSYTATPGLDNIDNVDKPWHVFISIVFVYFLAKTRHSWRKSISKGLLAVSVRPPSYGVDTSAIGIPRQLTIGPKKRPWPILFDSIDVAKSLQIPNHIRIRVWGVLLVPKVEVTDKLGSASPLACSPPRIRCLSAQETWQSISSWEVSLHNICRLLRH